MESCLSVTITFHYSYICTIRMLSFIKSLKNTRKPSVTSSDYIISYLYLFIRLKIDLVFILNVAQVCHWTPCASHYRVVHHCHAILIQWCKVSAKIQSQYISESFTCSGLVHKSKAVKARNLCSIHNRSSFCISEKAGNLGGRGEGGSQAFKTSQLES